MKVLTLFDGNINIIKYSQKDLPKIEHRGDATMADFTEFHSYDLLIDGSPCQHLPIPAERRMYV